MRMRRHHYQQEEDTGIDLTPMLDVVFIMLIFFIVTSSFIKESGVEVQRPQADTASTQDKGNILIAVTADGQVWIDKQVVDVRSVRAHVERLRVDQPEGAVVVQADQMRAPAWWCRSWTRRVRPACKTLRWPPARGRADATAAGPFQSGLHRRLCGGVAAVRPDAEHGQSPAQQD